MTALQMSDDRCVQGLEHSHHANENPSKKEERIAEIAGFGLQHLKLEMVRGGQGNMSEEMIKISNRPHIVYLGERHSLSSAIDTELSAEMAMQLDLIQAAGAMTKDLKDTIAEISVKADTLTSLQKLKFVEVVFNTYQLQQVNTGRIFKSTIDIEQLANDTLEIMRELATDVILPPSLKTSSLDIIKTTARTFQLPELDKAIIQFEKDTSPATILKQTVYTLKATLMALLDQDDLDADARQDIEDTLEKLNELEDGEPIPRDILKSLDAIAIQVADNQKNPALIAIVETLTQNIEAVREANILVKAEKFNLSIEQVRAIEATMDRLDALGEELPKDEISLKDMIVEAILALDSDPVSIKVMAKLEIVTDALQEPKFKVLEQSSPVIATLAAPIVISSRFIQKFLTEKVARKFDMPRPSVKQFVNLYKTIDNENRGTPKYSPLKRLLIATMEGINAKPSALTIQKHVKSMRNAIQRSPMAPQDFTKKKSFKNIVSLITIVPLVTFFGRQMPNRGGLEEKPGQPDVIPEGLPEQPDETPNEEPEVKPEQPDGIPNEEPEVEPGQPEIIFPTDKPVSIGDIALLDVKDMVNLSEENIAHLTPEDYSTLSEEQIEAIKQVQFGIEDDIEVFNPCDPCKDKPCQDEFKEKAGGKGKVDSDELSLSSRPTTKKKQGFGMKKPSSLAP